MQAYKIVPHTAFEWKLTCNGFVKYCPFQECEAPCGSWCAVFHVMEDGPLSPTTILLGCVAREIIVDGPEYFRTTGEGASDHP